MNSLKNKKFEYVLIIVKIRVSDVEVPLKNAVKKSGKKKIGKAEKKRLAAAKLAKANITFDNPEEALLFQVISRFIIRG